MTPGAFEEVAKQVPSLLVLCFVVWLFLKTLTFLVTAIKQELINFANTIKELHKEHIDERALSRIAYKEMVAAVTENTQCISHLLKVLETRK